MQWSYDMLSWVHFPYICWVCLLNKCEISNCYCRAMTRFGIKPCKQKYNYFQFWLKICICSFKRRPQILSMYTKKRGRRSDFKAEMHSWLIQRRGGTITSPFFCQKTLILCFENIISPSKRTYRCWNWVTSPLAGNTSCCLTRGSFVIYAK